MRAVIQLKPEDAEGRGGDILTNLGLHRSDWEPDMFSGSLIHMDYLDPDIPLSTTYATRRFHEALRDEGITPVRIKIEVQDQTGTYVTGSAANSYELDGTIAALMSAGAELAVLDVTSVPVSVLKQIDAAVSALVSD